jgi:hypothetical protein
MQVAQSQIAFYSGRISLHRMGGTVRFQCAPDDPRASGVDLPQFTFPADDSVYIHLRMRVTDQTKARHCEWDDFLVEKGTLVF